MVHASAGFNQTMYEPKERLSNAELIAFLRDIEYIAMRFHWCLREETHPKGYKDAHEMIAAIHKGKYKSASGFWVQFGDIIEELDKRLKN